MKAEKIETLMEILKEKRRFTLLEAEELAKQICKANTASYVTIEAISRLSKRYKLRIIVY